MLVLLRVMPRMFVIVRAVLAGMLVDVARPFRVLVRMLVLVLVAVRVGMLMRVRMLALAWMRVRMFVLVGMLVRVVVSMLVVALHGLPPAFTGCIGITSA